MKRSISHLAMALAMTMGAVGTVGVAAPAYAQKQPKMEISKEFQPNAVAIQESVNGAAQNAEVTAASQEAMTALNNVLAAGNDAAAKSSAQAQLDAARAKVDGLMGGIVAKLDAGRPTVSTPDDKLFFGQMELNAGQKLADFGMQNDGINMMIESGKLPPEELAKYHFFAGQTAFNDQDYAGARTSLQAAVDGGYTENNAEKLLVDAYLRDGMAAEGLTKLKAAIDAKVAAGQPVPEGWAFDGLAAAVNQDQRGQAFDWGILTLQTDTRAQARGQAYKIVEAYSPYTDEEQLDLMRLMYRDGAITDERQNLTYIELMQPLRRPGEAQAFLSNAPSSLPASNTMVTEAKRVSDQRASTTLSELDADASSSTGNGAVAVADTYLGYGKSAEAEALYRKALETGTTETAKAQMGLGIALTDQGKAAEAQEAFGQITSGNRASLAKAWSAYAKMKAGA